MNLFSGCIAIVAATSGDLKTAALWIITAAIFDFFDGFAARMLKSYSEIGKQLDSLADLVSFGVAPAMILFTILSDIASPFPFAPYMAFLIAIFSALRLAKFNIDTRQTENFIGLPTPSSALFIVSLPYILPAYPILISTVYPVLVIILFLCIMMVSEITLFSLKFKSFDWNKNKHRFYLLILSGIFLGLFNFAAIPLIIISYLILSAFYQKKIN